MRLFAVAAPGLEAPLAAELRELGHAGARAVTGGVELDGDEETLYRVNLWSRIATRVLARAGEFKANGFRELQRGAGAVDWRHFARGPVRVEVDAVSHRCRLYHTGAVAERVAEVIAGQLAMVADPAAPLIHVLARGEQDRFTLSVDTSGELLHRRGWRTAAGEAPLRETLAAALLRLAAWNPATPLVDPTCGSGTIPIEAALVATGRAPGAARAFAFQAWPGFRAPLWQRLLDEAAASVRPAPAPIGGFDRDPDVIAIARANAARAGVSAIVAFEVADATRLALAAGPALVLCNPPHGKRLAPSRALLGALGRLPARLAVLTPPALARHVGRPAVATHPLTSGGMRLVLSQFAAPRSPARS